MGTATATPLAAERAQARDIRLDVALWCAGIATFGLLYAPQGLLTQVSLTLSLDAVQASWLISGATLGLAASILPWALISDRIGRRAALQASTLSASVFALIGPFLPGFEGLLAGRVLLGVALGGVPALAMTYLHEATAVRRSAAVAAAFIAATSVGGLAGRIAAGPLAEVGGWRTSLIVLGVVGAALCIAAAILLPPARPAVTSLGESLRVLMRQFAQGRRLPLYAIGALSVGATVATYNSLMFRLESPPYLLPPSAVSLVFACYAAGTLTSRFSSSLAAAIGVRATLVVAGLVIGGGILTTLADPLWAVIAGVALVTGGMFLAHSTANAHVARTSGGGRQHAVALYSVSYYIGSSVCGVIGALAWASGGWVALAWTVCGLGLAIVLLSLAVSPARGRD
ncbi:MFS transporter [Microbacterium sp. 2FI]|uniref:MFS transporter n=1 Tax=Microbacterium sp. 2FI TaxID=2502193 RepID=UPI002017E34F|nr:MFS transporter [Microbacterium sp. 2FI]